MDGATSPEPPENVLPGATETSILLRLEDGNAVGVTALAVYPQGFLFELWLYQPPTRRRWRGVTIEPAVVGVRYADGRSGSVTVPAGPSRWPRALPAPGAARDLLVLPRDTSAGPGPARQQVWVSPLPTEGPVELTLSTPEGRRVAAVELDGGELIRAAGRAVEVQPAASSDPAFDGAFAPPLPPGGTPPQDSESSEAAIRDAFREVFTAGRDGFPYVQDGEVLRAPGEEARDRWPEVSATMRIGLGDLVFLDGTRAAVQYQLSWSGPGAGGPQLGYAVRERGAWKVARGTYCQLLDRAGVQYPPPPPVE